MPVDHQDQIGTGPAAAESPGPVAVLNMEGLNASELAVGRL
jgi:hypothetical protein